MEWGTTGNIGTYLKEHEDFNKKLSALSIRTSKGDKIMASVARMFEVGYFTEEKLIKWEKKAETDTAWVEVKTVFNKLWKNIQ